VVLLALAGGVLAQRLAETLLAGWGLVQRPAEILLALAG